jgi:hypothetical protein
MIVKEYDETLFRAITSLCSLGLFSIGIVVFSLSHEVIKLHIDLFLILLFFSLLIRFFLIYIVSRALDKVFIAGLIPSIWFILICYFALSDNLDIILSNEFLVFAIGPLFILIGVLRVIESFNTILASYQSLILALSLVDFGVGFSVIFDWPASGFWSVWDLLGIDSIITSFVVYLFLINFLKIEKYFPKVNK